MPVFSISEMPQLKNLTQKYGFAIHLHDACGGQSFTLEPICENTDDKIYDELDKFFSSYKMSVNFYDKKKLNFIAR